MEKSELLTLAREYAVNEDLYALLGIDSISAKESGTVQRAWRKASLQYHPDKARDKFDPEKWQFLERARDVLLDTEARTAYDSARSAALQRLQERQEMDARKRAMIEDLEARERGGPTKRMRDSQKHAMSEAERSKLAESGRRRMEEREKQKREAEERMRKADEEKTQTERQTDAEPGAAVDVPMETEPILSNGAGDEDSKIADLERRIDEARKRKEARKARKSGVMPPSSPAPSSDDAPNAHPPRQTQAQATPVKNPGTSELKADDKKGPSSAKSFSFSTPKSNASTPRAKGDFTSIKERLAAAQREKERKAKEAMESKSAQEA